MIMTTKRFTFEHGWGTGQELVWFSDRLVMLPCSAAELDEGHILQRAWIGYDRDGCTRRRGQA